MAQESLRLYPVMASPMVLFPGGQQELNDSDGLNVAMYAGFASNASSCAMVAKDSSLAIASIVQIFRESNRYYVLCTGRAQLKELFSSDSGLLMSLAFHYCDKPPIKKTWNLAAKLVIALAHFAKVQSSPLNLKYIASLSPERLSFLVASSQLLDFEEKISCLAIHDTNLRLEILLSACHLRIQESLRQVPLQKQNPYLFN